MFQISLTVTMILRVTLMLHVMIFLDRMNATVLKVSPEMARTAMVRTFFLNLAIFIDPLFNYLQQIFLENRIVTLTNAHNDLMNNNDSMNIMIQS